MRPRGAGPAVILLAAAAAVAASPSARGQEAEGALRVFEAKCVECHGPAVRKPKAGFGFVTDLAALRSDPDFVVPGRPEKSGLYLRLVAPDPKERMPPAKAKAGGLAPEEIESVRRWIEAGAPATAPADGSPEGLDRLLRWLGRFHPVVVHFPVALLLGAALAEILGAATRRSSFEGTTAFCLAGGALAAPLAAILGWFAAGWNGSGGSALATHRWLGIAAAVTSLASVLWLWRAGRRNPARVRVLRVLLALSAALVAVAGHFGAMLVHGRHHFDW